MQSDLESFAAGGAENLQKIKEQLDAGENVVFCSNHQVHLGSVVFR